MFPVPCYGRAAGASQAAMSAAAGLFRGAFGRVLVAIGWPVSRRGWEWGFKKGNPGGADLTGREGWLVFHRDKLATLPPAREVAAAWLRRFLLLFLAAVRGLCRVLLVVALLLFRKPAATAPARALERGTAAEVAIPRAGDHLPRSEGAPQGERRKRHGQAQCMDQDKNQRYVVAQKLFHAIAILSDVATVVSHGPVVDGEACEQIHSHYFISSITVKPEASTQYLVNDNTGK